MSLCIELSSDYACFTRPEMRVERVSYDVPTPSALRNIFQAILWKPAIEWHIDRIELLKPIRWMTIRRNEVGAVVSESKARTVMNRGSGRLQMIADEERQQRSALILRDVSYRVYAHFTMTKKAGPKETSEKFLGMFLRRARKGQCFRMPYMGCREFTADFRLVEPGDQRNSPISDTRALGWMFYDYDYSVNPPAAKFFNAKMESGIIHVPPVGSEEIRG